MEIVSLRECRLLFASQWRTNCFLIVLAMLVASCNRPPPTLPASVAYNDGFEVVVFDFANGTVSNVRSLPLKDAERAIASGSQALIPGDAAAIQQQLALGTSGDSKSTLSVQLLADGKQRVRVTFHESNRTFVYEYEVDGTHVRPIQSEYRDLGKSKVVKYANE
jgi:hypothetical protein